MSESLILLLVDPNDVNDIHMHNFPIHSCNFVIGLPINNLSLEVSSCCRMRGRLVEVSLNKFQTRVAFLVACSFFAPAPLLCQLFFLV